MSRAVCSNCKKLSDLVFDGFPNLGRQPGTAGKSLLWFFGPKNQGWIQSQVWEGRHAPQVFDKCHCHCHCLFFIHALSLSLERGATPPRCVSGKRGEFSECNSGLSSELPPSSAHSSVRQSAASRAGVRCWVRPRMRPTRARAPTTRAPRGATRPLGGARAQAVRGATSLWCPCCRWATCASTRRGGLRSGLGGRY